MSRPKRQKQRMRYPQIAIPPEVHARVRELKMRFHQGGVSLWYVIARGLDALEEKLNERE